MYHYSHCCRFYDDAAQNHVSSDIANTVMISLILIRHCCRFYDHASASASTTSTDVMITLLSPLSLLRCYYRCFHCYCYDIVAAAISGEGECWGSAERQAHVVLLCNYNYHSLLLAKINEQCKVTLSCRVSVCVCWDNKILLSAWKLGANSR